jgi:hypothetical protein
MGPAGKNCFHPQAAFSGPQSTCGEERAVVSLLPAGAGFDGHASQWPAPFGLHLPGRFLPGPELLLHSRIAGWGIDGKSRAGNENQAGQNGGPS